MEYSKGLTLNVNGQIITLALPAVLAKRVVNDDEKQLEHPITVLEVSVTNTGFNFATAMGVIHYEPEHFDDFTKDLGKAGVAHSSLLKLDTTGAAKILRAFYSWLNHKLAEEFERDIKAGTLTFEEARNIRKDVFDVPQFEHFFVQSFKAGNMPTAKKGKRRAYSSNVEELYALACRIYHETPRLSFESACFAATEQRSDLVPPKWCADPDGNLKREAARHWDKSPYSQLSYRQSRDR